MNLPEGTVPSDIHHHDAVLFVGETARETASFKDSRQPVVSGHSQPVTAFAECADGRLAGAEETES